MYRLSEEETCIVLARIEQAGLHTPGLASELLDHICCVMEAAMAEGAGFEEAYRQAYQTVSPNGYEEIEEEIIFLLTFHKQLNMKRILFIGGFTTTFLLSFGFLFKLMHWPMAGNILLIGLCTLLCTILYLAVYSFRMSYPLPLPHRIRIFTGLVCGFFIATGSILKALHYPGASLMIVLGMVLLNLVFLPLFFYQLYKKSIA